ncbi:MAG TPA: glycosyltransferase family 2 protein [Bacillota bacterium]|nr:glycosyltransferase family 2 protein [Bacillota bacterium]
MLSIIIPTFNEGRNVCYITERIMGVMAAEAFELIFVDDSTDETPVLLEQLRQQYTRVSYIHREGENGLATAVVAGFKAARGDVLTVMDGDLQHPPELLPLLLNTINQGSDLAIPSRFIPGGSDGGLSPLRRVISKSARLLAWLALRKTRRTSDPMSGFFICRKKVIEGIQLNPVGWKILLEILVKGNHKNIREVPYRFDQRTTSQSKMCLHQQLQFIRHLIKLVCSSPDDSRFWKFCLVGLSGVMVNLAVYVTLVNTAGVNVVLAGIISAFTAMFSNFLLNDQFTWKNKKSQPFYVRLARFYIYCSLGITLNALVLFLLYDRLGLDYLVSNLTGIIAATLWNFKSNSRWTWGEVSAELISEDS